MRNGEKPDSRCPGRPSGCSSSTPATTWWTSASSSGSSAGGAGGRAGSSPRSSTGSSTGSFTGLIHRALLGGSPRNGPPARRLGCVWWILVDVDGGPGGVRPGGGGARSGATGDDDSAAGRRLDAGPRHRRSTRHALPALLPQRPLGALGQAGLLLR